MPLKWLLGMDKLIPTLLWLFQSSGMPSRERMFLWVDSKKLSYKLRLKERSKKSFCEIPNMFSPQYILYCFVISHLLLTLMESYILVKLTHKLSFSIFRCHWEGWRLIWVFFLAYSIAHLPPVPYLPKLIKLTTGFIHIIITALRKIKWVWGPYSILFKV